MNRIRALFRSRRLWIALTAAWTAFIFLNSLLPGPASASNSGWVRDLLQGLLDALGLPLTVSELFIRKAAHYFEYTVLGILLGVAASRGAERLVPRLPSALFLGLLAPVADETLQLFVPGRAGMVQDVVLDFAGVLTGLLAATGIAALRRRRKRRKEESHADTDLHG